MVVALEPAEHVAQPLRVHLPPHRRVLGRRGRRADRAHELARVVVDAEEVERPGDPLEVARADGQLERRQRLEDVLGVRAAQERVEEQAHLGPVLHACGVAIRRSRRQRLVERQVDGDADPGAGPYA